MNRGGSAVDPIFFKPTVFALFVFLSENIHRVNCNRRPKEVYTEPAGPTVVNQGPWVPLVI